MNTVTVNASKSYEIHIGSNLLSTIGTEVAKLGNVQSVCIVSDTNVWPIYRREWTRETRLANPPVELVRKAIGLLYEIGKTILSAYDVYEY